MSFVAEAEAGSGTSVWFDKFRINRQKNLGSQATKLQVEQWLEAYTTLAYMK